MQVLGWGTGSFPYYTYPFPFKGSGLNRTQTRSIGSFPFPSLSSGIEPSKSDQGLSLFGPGSTVDDPFRSSGIERKVRRANRKNVPREFLLDRRSTSAKRR